MADTAWVLRGPDIEPHVGQTVVVMTGQAGEPLIVDVEVEGGPAHPERFMELYERIRGSVERPAS